ncbi:AAA-like domain-containing protein [Flavobacterium sp. W1B]|uniref:AAA-like domain-containing protein n=1 Tax=Flavobacterium sp. W1B TaxID=3394146 RepID=UPI0039BCDD9B
MNKILKPYTIVPSNLYVERSADRQVKNILEDMGRPGYVLVSRQMGKTNLLINARRKYSNDDDRFIYIDLSNLFDNEIQCFRNIIDTAIETNLDVFSQLEIDVREYRKSNSDLPPHKQHEKELRMLLKSIKGKLIIILDEIDALTKVEYSDRIFAQIRSVYFARTNYSEFGRLTYLLSGVVEPSELIKDPKISPFNIGEKIFLNDFSRSEFDSFLQKAELSLLDEKIKTRIFYWTNGNPRLTWDLCCIIEDQKEVIVTELDIDSIIKTYYLTAFDKPPVDNIREIVKKDPFIQDALIEIEYGKGDVIADDVKQKLYLSGIINYTENDIQIKNRIIKNSLSINWIDSIKAIEDDLLEKGVKLYNEDSYKRAISTLKNYLSKNNEILETSEEYNICHFHLGLSYYFEKDFNQALDNLTKTNFDAKKYGNLFFKTELFKGYAFQQTQKYDDAKLAFNKILSIGIKDEFYLNAKLNLALILSLKDEHVFEIEKANELFLEIANSKVEDYFNLDNEIFKKIKTQSLFALGNTDEYNDNSENVIYLNEALVLSPKEYQPKILFQIYKTYGLQIEKNEALNNIVNQIINNNLKLFKESKFNDLQFNQKLLREIQLEVFNNGLNIAFELIIEYEKLISPRYKDKIAIVDKLVGEAQELQYSLNFIFKLTEYLYNICENKSSQIYKNSLALLSSLNLDSDFKYSLEYIKVLDEDNVLIVDFEDVAKYLALIQNLLNKSDIKHAFEILDIGERLKIKLSNECASSVVLFDFMKMKCLVDAGQVSISKKLASSILNELTANEEDLLKNPLIRQVGIQNIVNYCENILFHMRNNIPLTIAKKIGRNDIVKVKYDNNKILSVKFKKVETDLKAGKCILIN